MSSKNDEMTLHQTPAHSCSARGLLPKRRSLKRRAIGTLIAAAALVGGCSSGDSSSPSETTSVSTANTTAAPDLPADNIDAPTTVATSSVAIAGSTEDTVLLVEFYSLLGIRRPEEGVMFLGANVPEEQIATCMADAGFQYRPGAGPEEQLASSPGFDLSVEEWAATYGLGIAAADLGMFPPAPVDPNIDYVSSLTEGQRDAYTSAYWTCRGSTPDRIAHSDALNVAVAQIRDASEADDRVVAARDTWTSCMAASGFDYDSPEELRDSFYARLSQSSGRTALEAVHADEVAVAVANVPCEAAYQSVYRDVVLERFDEFKALYTTALTSGATPDGNG